MKIAPLCLVPKKNSDKVRVCSNMSFGNPSPNSLIDRNQTCISMDSLISFAPFLINRKKKLNSLILWKSDVDSAYRNCPMSPQWQIRQIIRVKNGFRIDYCCNFGSSGSAKVWCSVFSIILWITEFEFGIKEMRNLMDDSWGVNFAYEMVHFKDHVIPLDQAKLLSVFDLLGVPWNWKKTYFRFNTRDYWSHCQLK